MNDQTMKTSKPKLPKPSTKRMRVILLIGMATMSCLAAAGAFWLASRIVGSSAIQAFQDIIDPEAQGESGDLFMPQENLVELSPWDGVGQVNMLVMGLDYRDWSAGEGPSRTDTMIVLTMDPLNKTAGMLSIPRDLWVPIPGFESGRINTAYFLGEANNLPGGGPALAVATVEQLLGVPIHYYAQIDFFTFEKFIDEIGGIVIYVKEPITLWPIGKPKVTLQPDAYRVGGDLALAYARTRYTEKGDFDRSQRQQEVILAIRRQIVRYDMVPTLISKAPAIYSDFSAGIQTNLTLDEIFKLAVTAQQIDVEDIQRGAISTGEVSFGESDTGASILIPHPEAIRELRDQIFTGSGLLSPLSGGTAQERMQAESARLMILNGTMTEGLAARTQEYLQSQGANVVEVSGIELNYNSVIIDNTSNPGTVSYLVDLLRIPPENIYFEYDPTSAVDVIVKLGTDWADNNPMP